MFTDQALNTKRGKGNSCAGPVLPSTSQVNFVSQALLTNRKKQTKRKSLVRKLAEPSRQVRETWHRHAGARPGRARVGEEGSKLRATSSLPSPGTPRGGADLGALPPAAPPEAPAPPPCRSRRRGAPVPLFPLKAKVAEGPTRQPPDCRPRRSPPRHKARRGEAGPPGLRRPGQAGAGPSARARPGRGPSGRGTHPGEEALPELDPLQALYVEHGGARPKGLAAAAGSLLLAPPTRPVPSQAVTSARQSDLT